MLISSRRKDRWLSFREKCLVGALLIILSFSGAMHYSSSEETIDVRGVELAMTLERVNEVQKLAEHFRKKAGRYPKSGVEIRMMFPEVKRLQIINAWGQPIQFFNDAQGGLRIMSRWVPDGEKGSIIVTAELE